MPVLKLPEVDLSYELAGSGPPVVLIQGVGVARSGWQPQVDGLRESFQLLTFDNRGLGRSVPCRGSISIEAMADDLRALLDAVGWPSAHVAGHSMGGMIAQQFALDCPQRVRSLSLLCTFARGKDATKFTAWILWMMLRTRLGSRAMRRRAFLDLVWPADLLRTADTGALMERFTFLMGRDLAEQPPILMKQFGALARHDMRARLGELKGIPTWVLSAALDRIASVETGRRLAAGIPGARFELMEGAAHAANIQCPEVINRWCSEFWAAVEKTRPG